MAELLKFVSALSVLHDDRNAIIYHGQVAHLTKARAKLILDCQPGVLEPIKQAEKKKAKPQPVPDDGQVDGGASSSVEIVDLRTAVAALYHSSRRAIARKLGGGDDLTTADADEIIAAASDHELAEAAADQLEA
jgi:hypothetical protein